MNHDTAIIPSSPLGDPSGNLIWNPNHDMWSNGNSGSYSSTGGETADDVFVGPGTGATVDWSRVVNDGSLPTSDPYWLRFQWLSVATSGEAQYLPGFRYTFLERHFTAPNVARLRGKNLTLTVWLRGNGPNNCLPICWYNLKNGDYSIYTGPQINFGTTWTQYTVPLVCPNYDPTQHSPDSSDYVGVGLDWTYQTAPVLDIGPMDFRVLP